jgi:phosphoglycolate phosphatase
MPYSAILFDLDGTLLNTLADLGNSMNAVLRSMGLPVHPLDAYKRFVGDGLAVLARRALPPDRQDDAAVDACVAAMRREYGVRAFDRTRPYDGIPELLNECARRGLATAVVSNKPHDMTVQMVGRLLDRWRFNAVFGARDGVPRKPDPAAILEAAAVSGTDPSRFVYLGDTGTDMRAATAAGMYPVGALWGFRDERELRENGARMCIWRPQEALPLFA